MFWELERRGSEAPLGRAKTLEELYSRFLGLPKFPSSPETMPPAVFLPPQLLGALETAILLTGRDHLERGQNIYCDPLTGAINSSRLFTGSTTEIEIPDDSIDRFLVFHTHPESRRPNSRRHPVEPSFSNKDVAFLRTEQGFIEVVGASTGVAAILQTQQWPQLTSDDPSDEIIARLKRNSFGKKNHPRIASLLEQEGIAYYRWRPKRGFIVRGDLRNGLRLSRVFPIES